MLEYGTNIVAGVTPGKAGRRRWTVGARVRHGADAVAQPARTPRGSSSRPPSPPTQARGGRARCPARDLHHEGSPPWHAARYHVLRSKGCGSSAPTVRPDVGRRGQGRDHPRQHPRARPGRPGVALRDRTYESCSQTDAGMGQTTTLGIGGDPVVGTSFIDALDLFNQDPGRGDRDDREIGGEEEEKAAAFVAREVRKPMAAFIAGRTAPPGRGWATPERSSRRPAVGRRVQAAALEGPGPRRRLPIPHPAAAQRGGRPVVTRSE